MRFWHMLALVWLLALLVAIVVSTWGLPGLLGLVAIIIIGNLLDTIYR
jgi:hypothetical protein